MQYLDNDARIAATIGGYRNPVLFRNREELDEYQESLKGRSYAWQGKDRPIPNQKLWDEDPERFPCLMLTAAEMHNPEGADWIINMFMYDVEIHEESAYDCQSVET